MLKEIKKDAGDRMDKSVVSLKQELTKLRTGRAHTSLLDHITVEYYGSQVPLNQVSNVNVEDPRTLTISPWDKGMVACYRESHPEFRPRIESRIGRHGDQGSTAATDRRTTQRHDSPRSA